LNTNAEPLNNHRGITEQKAHPELDFLYAKEMPLARAETDNFARIVATHL